ncbi:MAG: GxxExxY protein [Kiritimatiellia bacterium]
MKLIHEDISYRIRGGLFDVQNEVGLGRDEEMYHKAFASWLCEHEIPFYSKPRHELRLFDTIAHVLYPDFVVADQVVVELKSRSSALKDGDKAQLVNYLKLRNDRLGLLVNMNGAQLPRPLTKTPVWDKGLSIVS